MEEPITRACAWCEQEFGVRYPGKNVSHGYCKRHTIRSLKFANISDDNIAAVVNKPDANFVEDLAEHPEIVARLKGEPEDEGPGPDDYPEDHYNDQEDKWRDRQLFPRN